MTITSSTIDLHKLRADIRDTVSEIRDTKGPLRTRWTTPMHEHQHRLQSLKARATRLCILRAHARGRVHLARDPDLCRQIAAKLAPSYARQEVAA